MCSDEFSLKQALGIAMDETTQAIKAIAYVAYLL